MNLGKKLVGFLAVGTLAFSLAACSGGGSSSTSTSGEKADTKPKEEKVSKYPEKMITIIAPSGAGGGLDTAARTIAKVAADKKLVEQSISVENKPGGGQVLGMTEFVQKEKGNDYALLLPSTPTVLNFIKKDGTSPYSFRDLTPLARLQVDYPVIAVNADSKYNDLKSLFDDIKADPSSITIAGGGAPGTLDHLNSILLAESHGIDGNKVKFTAYDGGAEAMTALVGGHADALTTDVSGVAEYLKAGKIKVLGVAAPERMTGDFADLVTYKEQGFDVEVANWRGVFGPKDMSDEAKAYWEEKLKEISDSDEWNAELAKMGVQNGYMNATDFLAALEKEEADYLELYKKLGMAK
ncbi:tripartite tricarboxylate transporter substrate binding protein [Bacillus sp. JJ1521]|uniref:tripartite tricarboxylate transporter substrate binding protein n=1 Tax=Bacillus sp. JJ1521 TaxID=3122957 RepID=UPI002FFE2BAF